MDASAEDVSANNAADAGADASVNNITDSGHRDAEPDATEVPDMDTPDLPVATFTIRGGARIEALSTENYGISDNALTAVYSSSDESVLSFEGNVATAHKPGIVTISATADGAVATKVVSVFWEIAEVAVGSQSFDPTQRTFVCVSTSTGRVFCWGKNQDGQSLQADTIDTVAPWQGQPNSGRLIKLDAANSSVCGLTPGVPQLRCWGENGTRTLGNLSTADTHVPAPVQLPAGVGAVKDFGCMRYSCCAITNTDTVCWGDGWNPVSVTGMENPEALAKGGDHFCIMRGGEVFCAGDGDEGQLGAMVVSSEAPLKIPELVNVDRIWSGDDHLCASLSTVNGRQYKCWGENSNLQAGQSGYGKIYTPQVIAQPVNGFESLALGGDASCGLDDQGTAYCWGTNAFSMLGSQQTVEESAATNLEVATSVKFKKLDVGGRSICAISTDNELYCWGENVPELVPGGGPVVEVPTRVPNPWE